MTGDTPLRILLAGDYAEDPTLGSSKVPLKLQAEFIALGHTCDIVWDREIGGPRFRQMRQLVAPWYAGKAITRRLDGDAYDVVDVTSAEGLWLGVLKKTGAYRNCPYICRSNGLEQLNYGRMLDDAREGLTSKPWTRRLWYPVSRLSQVATAAHLADRLILTNDGDREYALSHGWQSPDRVDVIPHGLSPEFLDCEPGDTASRGAGLLFCGSWDHMKGIAYLVRAFELLHRKGAHANLTVLGPGVPEAIVMKSFPEAVRPFVRVLPRAAEAAVRASYRAHDVLLWTSTYEGFGLVLLEAMSQRMAIVSTPVGCAAALVKDGATGLLVPPRDAEEIAAAAERLLADAELRRRLGDAARQAVAGMSWRATAVRTLDAYRTARSERAV